MDARAHMAYEEYMIRRDEEPHVRNEELSEYLDGYLIGFVTGTSDVSDDDSWNEYVSGAEELLH